MRNKKNTKRAIEFGVRNVIKSYWDMRNFHRDDDYNKVKMEYLRERFEENLVYLHGIAGGLYIVGNINITEHEEITKLIIKLREKYKYRY